MSCPHHGQGLQEVSNEPSHAQPSTSAEQPHPQGRAGGVPGALPRDAAPALAPVVSRDGQLRVKCAQLFLGFFFMNSQDLPPGRGEGERKRASDPGGECRDRELRRERREGVVEEDCGCWSKGTGNTLPVVGMVYPHPLLVLPTGRAPLTRGHRSSTPDPDPEGAVPGGGSVCEAPLGEHKDHSQNQVQGCLSHSPSLAGLCLSAQPM